ncbi:MAG: phosphotransferase family protein [Cytophagales bacterium]|jgi:aminoglycoside phosphotransferase (APT) family kinase protein|nr:phosphotransferase family protein [Cytophagales bacterium]MCA6386514.1 phosphotransferase family protein [Cytophagales bacterium]MCA6389976.1 phosphotransferase family protein [Cytophagales bacterium]MCA6395109.1 phosphotransferase family protein [Cytophagales bacterium]MCA6398136.1 phosphotransferase family protein [Cytophagales bacterium]
MLDQPSSIRAGEELNQEKLATYLNEHGIAKEISIQQFPNGYSNLTYLIKTEEEEYILRRPPFGANIKSAHDMEREFNVLSSLQKAGFTKVPEPILFCADESVMGTKFYLMKRVNGVILRNRVPKGMTIAPSTFNQLSKSAIDQLVQLHQLDIKSTGLDQLGKPEGYVQRQVEGWTKRYVNAQTDDIAAMNEAAEWMQKNIPTSAKASFIHNDYKYDNLVLNPDNLTEIKAILDWEMATVGDPLMDLGTTLAYWAEANDSDALKPFNLTWMPGNMTRNEMANYYAEKSQTSIDDIVFYYVFGSFKVGVICQQIYHRYKQGYTQDPRFASLIYLIKACGENARRAIFNSLI